MTKVANGLEIPVSEGVKGLNLFEKFHYLVEKYPCLLYNILKMLEIVKGDQIKKETYLHKRNYSDLPKGIEYLERCKKHETNDCKLINIWYNCAKFMLV